MESMAEDRLKTLRGLRFDRAKRERLGENRDCRNGNARNARGDGCPRLVSLFLPRAAAMGMLLITGVLMRGTLAARHAVRCGGLPSGTRQLDGGPDRQDCKQQRGEGSRHSRHSTPMRGGRCSLVQPRIEKRLDEVRRRVY